MERPTMSNKSTGTVNPCETYTMSYVNYISTKKTNKTKTKKVDREVLLSSFNKKGNWERELEVSKAWTCEWCSEGFGSPKAGFPQSPR